MTSTSTAQPLKVIPATPARNTTDSEMPDKLASAKKAATVPKPSLGPSNISSPHELTAFVRVFSPCFSNESLIGIQVETLLEQLDTKFDEMSSQMLDRSTFVRYF